MEVKITSTMKSLSFALLLALCRRTPPVLGFGLLLPSSSHRNTTPLPSCHDRRKIRFSNINNNDVRGLRPHSTRDHDHRQHGLRGVTMMAAFWKDIVQGGGGGGQKGTTTTPSSSLSRASSADSKSPVLICPAQLSVPSDYQKMVKEFKER